MQSPTVCLTTPRAIRVTVSVLVTERRHTSDSEACLPHDEQVAYSSWWSKERRIARLPPEGDNLNLSQSTEAAWVGLPSDEAHLARSTAFPRRRRQANSPYLLFRHGSTGRQCGETEKNQPKPETIPLSRGTDLHELRTPRPRRRATRTDSLSTAGTEQSSRCI